MCGIAGQVRSDGAGVSGGLIERMCGAIHHRGPDSHGQHVDRGAGIGIARLRVIDLETGDQPIYNEDRSLAVVLNGEIYNYRELRRELIERGHRFETKGDTEVIVHLYEEEGPECVKRLHGMFAFALWDERRGRLLVARDRIGKKPLLYAQRHGTLSFASEVGALLQDTEIPREVDLGALDAYLAYGYVPAPMSAFRAVRKLPPGSLMLWQDGELEIQRYWRLRYEPKSEQRSAGELHEEIRARLLDAVRKRMISDVPLGAFLSGGIDSSAVVAAMAQLSSEPVRTFSIGFEDEAFSELPRAREVAERYGTDHHEYVIEPKALDLIPGIVRHYGEPFADTSSVPSFAVSELARRHVTVALNGDGGDESFAGYHRYQSALAVARGDRIPGPLRRLVGRAGAASPEHGEPRAVANRARRLAKQLAMSSRERHALQMSALSWERREALYTPEMLARVDEGATADVIARPWEEASGSDLVDILLEVDVNTYLPDDLCVKIDIATMAHSLEARSPFLDHEFMEFAAALPPDVKIRGGRTKVALREALVDWLPESILEGPKRGFAMPVVTEWFRGELRSFVSDILLDPQTIGRGYFREEAVRKLIDDHVSRAGDNSQPLWALMMLELWHREFIDPPAVSAGR